MSTPNHAKQGRKHYSHEAANVMLEASDRLQDLS